MRHLFQAGMDHDQELYKLFWKTKPPRSNICLRHVNKVIPRPFTFDGGILNAAVGLMFANKKLDQDKKKLVEEMANAIR